MLNTILNVFFPPTCIFCGDVMDFHTDICACEGCVSELPYIQPAECYVCGRPLDALYTDEVCGGCLYYGQHFDANVSCYVYSDAARDCVLDFKFNKRIDYASTMSKIMVARILQKYGDTPFDMVVPVPLSKERLKTRGYNQSALLAKRIAAELQLPYVPDVLIKKVDTFKQSLTSAQERRNNISGAFGVSSAADVKNKTVLLIDDILTTGATLNECAKTLKQSGALSVCGAVFAVTDNRI